LSITLPIKHGDFPYVEKPDGILLSLLTLFGRGTTRSQKTNAAHLAMAPGKSA